MKKILIVGKNSYIGKKLFSWLNKWPDQYQVTAISASNDMWRTFDLSGIDVVVNFAGLAHINKITLDMESLFYSVNRDLAIELCKTAREKGITHFIQLSSMNVYGDFCGYITNRDDAKPTSFYGNSKLEGDKGILSLADKHIKVTSIRPPFVYGKGCKGNYNTVRKLALCLPFFPTYKNRKSMIYVDNLCEFIRLTIDNEAEGVLTPQNRELVSTSDLVTEIAYANNHCIHRLSIFNWCIPLLIKISGMVKKAFVDDSYSLNLSDYYNWEYCVVDFKESIALTERDDKNE